jgi:diaminopimelate epimerase
MTARLTKHHGLGNDFLVALDEVVGVPGSRLGPAQARAWCDRRQGIGADGLIRGEALEPGQPDGAELAMHLWNADGSRAEMSGNGIRCLAQAVLLARGLHRATLPIRTDGGLRVVEAQLADEGRASVKVRMGEARPGPAIPEPVLERFAGHRLASLDVGNPHVIVEVPDPSAVDLLREGPWVEQQFTGGVNVEFIAAGDEPDALHLVVWERGAGITHACGTGATAAAQVAHDWGLVGRLVEVRMPGGSAQVEVGADLVLIGPSQLVATVEPFPPPPAASPDGHRERERERERA